MKKLIIWGSILFVLMLAFAWIMIFQSANLLDGKQIEVDIPSGSAAGLVQTILTDKGVLPRYSSFLLVVKVFDLSSNIQAGKYLFSPADPLYRILLKLKRGESIPPEQIKITFPEGTSIYKMGESLKKFQVSDPVKFQGLVNEGITAEIRQSHWTLFKYIPSESLEGYLYPDTYLFFPEEDVSRIVEKMLSRFEEVVLPFWAKAAKETSFSLHEILTLASIIEKEAQLPVERPIIASVFYNRLKVGMPLAADPTIKYALENPTKRVYLDQLSVNSLYNTYKRKGLPPGPICNPGLDSITAAVYPATTGYFFFVARPDGSHIFSRTWQEHQLARQKAAAGKI